MVYRCQLNGSKNRYLPERKTDMTATEHQASQNTNLVGLSRAEYRGAPSTLCQGCGHNGIAAQIVAACYEMNIVPENMVKFSGIGCSSKSPTYFLGRSFCLMGCMVGCLHLLLVRSSLIKHSKPLASAVMAIPPA